MKSHTEYLVFETRKRREMVHITDEVEQIVARSGVKDGLCFVSPMHITAAVYVNDHESGLIEDIGKWLEAWPGAARLQAPSDGRGRRRRASQVAAVAPRDHAAGDCRDVSISARGSASSTPSSTASAANGSS